MDQIYKEVYFDKYCSSCEHKDSPEVIEENGDKKAAPCMECLNNPVNLYSHKPVNYKPK